MVRKMFAFDRDEIFEEFSLIGMPRMGVHVS